MNQEKLAVRIFYMVMIVVITFLVILGINFITSEAEEMPTINSITTAERSSVEGTRVKPKRVEETTTLAVETTTKRVEETEVSETQVKTIQVNGKSMEESLQRFLYESLKEYGCEWWFEYAMCQAYQESNFIVDCISTHQGENNNDCGLYQFKEKWWSWYEEEAGVFGDIMNPYVQIEVYAFHVCRWINEGLSVEQVLSNWYTGGQGYYQEYVDQVMRWKGTIQ